MCLIDHKQVHDIQSLGLNLEMEMAEELLAVMADFDLYNTQEALQYLILSPYCS